MPDDTLFLTCSFRGPNHADEIAPSRVRLTGHTMSATCALLETIRVMLIQQPVGGGHGYTPERLGSEHVRLPDVQEASGGFVWYAVELERPQRVFNRRSPSPPYQHCVRLRLARLAFP